MTDINLLCHNVGESLKAAVIEALETKRRMGHYAVIVENGEPRRVPAEQLEPLIAAAKVK